MLTLRVKTTDWFVGRKLSNIRQIDDKKKKDESSISRKRYCV